MFCRYLFENCSFLMREEKGIDAGVRGGGEKLKTVEGGETVLGYSV